MGFCPGSWPCWAWGLTDLSYLLGLFSLWKFRRQIRHDLPLAATPASRLAWRVLRPRRSPSRAGGSRVFLSTLPTATFPMTLALPNFVTMAEIEGPEFRPTGDTHVQYGLHLPRRQPPSPRRAGTTSSGNPAGSLTPAAPWLTSPIWRSTSPRYLLPRRSGAAGLGVARLGRP